MSITFPSGSQTQFHQEIATKCKTLRAVADENKNHREAPRVPDSKHSKDELDQKIARHRQASTAAQVRMRYKFPPSSHAHVEPKPTNLYRQRDPELNNLFFSYSGYETETPSKDNIGKLPEQQQAFYDVRYIGKRGRYLSTGEPIEGEDSGVGTVKSSPALKSQSQDIHNIRAEAATATVSNYLNMKEGKKHFIYQLHERVIKQLSPDFLKNNGKVHIVRPSRDPYSSDAVLNFLTFCTQTEIAAALNAREETAAKEENRQPIEFTDNKCLMDLTRSVRTDASAISRLAHQPYFSTNDDVAPGDKVIIANDHVQAGGTALSMASALKEAGADILGVVAFTTHPYCTNFKLDDRIEKHMRKVLQQWDPEEKVLNELAKMGLPLNTLTSAEAMTLIACATDPDNAKDVEEFGHLEKHLTKGITVMEDEHGSLKLILDAPSKSPEEVVSELQWVATNDRKIVEHTPVKKVEVLDWDSLIANDKDMNYQLTANSVFIAAHNHAETHPVLQQIASALRPYFEGEKEYQEGMPKLCMSREAFSEYGIGHPDFYKSHVAIDLLDNLAAIAPDISIDNNGIDNEKKQIINILQMEFRRQHKEFTRPLIVDEELSARLAQKTADLANKLNLPFKDVRLEFMPNAKEFLDKIRTPDARLALISNKGNDNLRDEANKLGVAHYFDLISGMPQISADGKVKRLYPKPESHRLKQALEELSLRHRKPSIRLWGDRAKDITQAADLLESRIAESITGVIVNSVNVGPARPDKVKGIPVSYQKTLQPS